MSQIPYRGNLQAMSFPLLSRLAGRTVINAPADQVFVPNQTTDGQVPIDRGAASVVYAHNIMPSTYGWQSVGYTTIYTAPAAGEAAIFRDIHFVQCTRGGTEPEPTGTKVYIAFGEVPADDQGYLYVTDPSNGNFRRITGGLTHPTTGDDFVFPIGTQMSSVTLNGVTYFYLSGIGCFLYDDSIDSLIYRELKGLDAAAIQGITGSNGYMLAWTINSVSWSSSVDIEDFEPSDVSGAGGGSLQEAKGPIVVGLPTIHGVIFFTTENAVSASYSGNDDFPWTFKGITGAGGISSPQQVSRDQVGGYFYTFSTFGIQQVSHVVCKSVFPHVSDFIAGGIWEDYDVSTGVLSELDTGYALPKQLAGIGNRYVVISYGKNAADLFTHAVVLDLNQSRMGKLRMNHSMVFSQQDITFSSVESARDTLALMLPSGLCKAVDFSFSKVAFDAVLILGKFQLSRTNLMSFEEVELENVETETSFTCSVYSSLNGKDLGTRHDGYLLSESPNYKHYLFDAVGINHSLLLKGTFNVISYVIWGAQHGRI